MMSPRTFSSASASLHVDCCSSSCVTSHTLMQLHQDEHFFDDRCRRGHSQPAPCLCSTPHIPSRFFHFVRVHILLNNGDMRDPVADSAAVCGADSVDRCDHRWLHSVNMDDLLEKARDTGDEGFGMCLDSGTADIETVSARYLRSVLGNVDTAVLEYLKVPEQLMMSVANLAKAHHPDVSTSPAFMTNIMRPALISNFKAGADAGLAFLAYEAYPWSPAHPVPWKMSEGYAGWGSRCLIAPLTISSGIKLL